MAAVELTTLRRGAKVTRRVQGVGPAGPTIPNILTIGTVETIDSDQEASADIEGITPSQKLNLRIPRGPEDANSLKLAGDQVATGRKDLEAVTFSRVLDAPNADYNTLLLGGRYVAYGTTTNGPAGAPNNVYWVDVSPRSLGSADYTLQTATNWFDPAHAYTRTRTAGTWSPWVRVWNGANLVAGTTAGTFAAGHTTVNKSGDQTVDGVKTHTSSPIVPTPALTDTALKPITAAYLSGLRSCRNPKQYTTGMTGLLAAFADGDTIDLPAGYWTLPASNPTIANKSFSVLGDGPDLAILLQQNAGDGLRATQDTHFRGMTFKDFSLQTSQGAGGAALLIDRSAGNGSGGKASSIRSLIVDNVKISGADVFSHYWQKCISIKGGGGGQLNNLWLHGLNGQQTGIGVELLGCATVVSIDRPWMFNLDTAVYGAPVSGQEGIEGLQVLYAQIVACNTGIHFLDGIGFPLIEAIGGHYNARKFGVRAFNQSQVKVKGIAFYRNTGGPPYDPWVAIQLGSCHSSDIVGNDILGLSNQLPSSPPAGYGVIANSCNALNIHDNKFALMDVAIDLQNNTKAKVTENTYESANVPVFLAQAPAGGRYTPNYAIAANGDITVV